jgi:hypothetical protein
MSKRKPARIPRVERYHGVDWLEHRVPLVAGGRCHIVGVSRDAPRGLLAFWRRESERLNRDTQEVKAA